MRASFSLQRIYVLERRNISVSQTCIQQLSPTAVQALIVLPSSTKDVDDLQSVCSREGEGSEDVHVDAEQCATSCSSRLALRGEGDEFHSNFIHVAAFR